MVFVSSSSNHLRARLWRDAHSRRASRRLDPLHQRPRPLHGRRPLRLRLKHAIVTKLGRRKATLFMLLDEQLAPLRWGWLQAEANHQAAASSLWSSVALNAAL